MVQDNNQRSKNADDRVGDFPNEPMFPDVGTHREDTCPLCGEDHSSMEVYQPDIFSEEYEHGVDQTEVYYRCNECPSVWRRKEIGDKERPK